MRLLMAVSADGFVARGPDDDMRWLGPHDKAVFQLLTRQDEVNVLVRSRRTAMAMPKALPGRTLVEVSTKGKDPQDLLWAQAKYPNAWMVGGQTLALEALRLGMIRVGFICQSTRYAFDGIPSELDTGLEAAGLRLTFETTVADVKVKRYGR